MADKHTKTPAGNQERPVDKSLARRDRQAQALRQNLARRKAQMRDRTDGDVTQGAAERPKDEPSRN